MIKLLGENLIHDLFLLHCKADTLQVWELVMTNNLVETLKIARGEGKRNKGDNFPEQN